MPNHLVTSAGGPGVIGLAISGMLYGVSLGQSFYYICSFPDDPLLIKSLVLLVFVVDICHLTGTTQFYWALLVLCHRSDSAACETELPWGAKIAVPANYLINLAVQGFYSHRIWIITNGHRGIAPTVVLIAIVQFGIGIYASAESIKEHTINFLFTTPLIPLAAAASTVCDIIITVTIFKNLWRSEIGRTSVIRDLVVVFVNMGVLTCLISIVVGVVYLAQGNHYWIEAPAVVLSRCYANSLLAVLNARRRIRERELSRLQHSVEVPNLSIMSTSQ